MKKLLQILTLLVLIAIICTTSGYLGTRLLHRSYIILPKPHQVMAGTATQGHDGKLEMKGGFRQGSLRPNQIPTFDLGDGRVLMVFRTDPLHTFYYQLYNHPANRPEMPKNQQANSRMLIVTLPRQTAAK